MAKRSDLGILLKTILESNAVYFQPPKSTEMVYPCIVYERSYIKTEFANNTPYLFGKLYTVTVIDRDPDSLIPDKIASLPKCTFDRHFTADNLNHDVFSIYF